MWVVWHLPLTASIATTGAAMVTLIEHAADPRAPVGAALLVTGSVAVGLISLIMIVRTLQDFEALRAVFVPTSLGMVGGAAAALLIGVWRPAPIVLVASLAIVQTLVWLFGIDRWLRAEMAGAQRSGGDLGDSSA